jgi:polyisoprenoid-binding protein YceI
LLIVKKHPQSQTHAGTGFACDVSKNKAMPTKNGFLFTGILLFAFAACTQAPKSDQAKISEPETVKPADTTGVSFPVDVAQSKIEWIGTKVSGHHEGTVLLKGGEVLLADGEVEGGNFIMDMTSITVTGPAGTSEASNKKLQGHLHSADFFEVNTHPEAKFEITEIKPYAGVVKEEENDPRQQAISKYKVTNPTHLVSGNLTIKGIAKNITFPAQITVTPDYAEAIAKFNIDRREWNITYPGQPDDLIRDDIHLGISLMAKRTST